MKQLAHILVPLALPGLIACGSDDDSSDVEPKDPDTAEVVAVDRFSAEAGTAMVRDATNGLPDANVAIDFDQAPFLTQGYGPNGEIVKYYNFDVQPTTPAPIYVFFREGADTPLEGQLNVIDVIPGDAGYNDFWLVNKVTVPDDYVANSVTSFQEITDAGFTVEATDMIVNCPVVPAGSTAALRFGAGENKDLVRGWYKGQIANYFEFSEAPITAAGGLVPAIPIYVTFNTNPGEAGGGPPSGFVAEAGSEQTHNVLQALPADASYSPLWTVLVYDNAEFDDVSDLTSAMAATSVDFADVAVNCPTVDME